MCTYVKIPCVVFKTKGSCSDDHLLSSVQHLLLSMPKVISISLWAPLITVRKKSECFHLHIKGLLQNHRNTLSSMTPNMFQFTASYRMISKTLLVVYLLSHMSISLVSHRLILRDLEDVYFLYVMVFRTIKNTCKAAKL